jgi:hypothetical protein
MHGSDKRGRGVGGDKENYPQSRAGLNLPYFVDN